MGEPSTLSYGIEAVGAFVGLVVVAALWIRKLKPSWAVDDKLAAAANADVGIIGRLEREAKRLADQNESLAKSVNALQVEVTKLVGENAKLHAEVQSLREENHALRVEIRELMNMERKNGKS